MGPKKFASQELVDTNLFPRFKSCAARMEELRRDRMILEEPNAAKTRQVIRW